MKRCQYLLCFLCYSGWIDYIQLGFGQCDICDFAEWDECVVEGFGSDLTVEAADEDCCFFAGLVGHFFPYFV